MTIVKISTNAKNANGEFYTDFSSRVKLIGNAHNANVQEGDKIKIVRCGVSNSYNRETQQSYTDFVIFDLEKIGTSTLPQPRNDSLTPPQPSLDDFSLPKVDESELPF